VLVVVGRSCDLGAVMAAMGVGVAIKAADVALTGEDLRHLPRRFSAPAAPGRSCCRISGVHDVVFVLMPLARSAWRPSLRYTSSPTSW
jgi:cation-transporting ATPase G